MNNQNTSALAADTVHMNIRYDGVSPQNSDHYHKSFEVYYLKKGSCWYFIDKKSYHLSEGDIALIPIGVIHKTNYDTHTSSRIVINCDDRCIPASCRELIQNIPYFAKSSTTASFVEKLFDRMQYEHQNPDAFSNDAIRVLLAELFLLIARESGKPREEKPESPIVEKAVSYVHSHYMHTVSLQAVAEHCFVSRSHLSRIFKKETGFGFNEYLNLYRLRKANALLAEDAKIQISQLAIQCGFSDSNYFSKQYKKMYGVSPIKTRKRD